MLTELKSNRSLTFYQSSSVAHQSIVTTSNAGGIASVGLSATSFQTVATTNGFNQQLQDFLSYFSQQRANDAASLNLSSSNQAARQRGVYRAWEYEKADIMMGGKGSENWTEAEQQQIKDNVKFDDQAHSKAGVSGAEGHHQKNVADHPADQANPDNIKFYRTKEEHLQEGHDGDFRNESNAKMNDKDQMLKDTNTKRVFKNELTGLGIAVAIGIGVGMTIGFVTELGQSGITPDSLKNAMAAGLKGGIESGVMAGVGYGIGRTIGEVISGALSGTFENIGISVTENISKMVNMGVVGALTIIVFSVYQFIKLKITGISTKEALIQTGKQALFSISLLAVSIAAQGIWGGPAGIIVSVGAGIILVSYSVANSVHQRHFSEKVRVYTIDKCYPEFVF